MKIKILSCAEGEFAETVDYYNKQLPGLGYEFAAQVKVALERMATFPNAWPSFSTRSRRCILNKFPYGILYQVREDMLLVLAIMDLRCDPKRWEDRLKIGSIEKDIPT